MNPFLDGAEFGVEAVVQSMLVDAAEMDDLLKLAELDTIPQQRRTRAAIAALDIAQNIIRFVPGLPTAQMQRRPVARALRRARRAVLEWQVVRSTGVGAPQG